MEVVGHALVFEPGAGLLHRVAVLDAVNRRRHVILAFDEAITVLPPLGQVCLFRRLAGGATLLCHAPEAWLSCLRVRCANPHLGAYLLQRIGEFR